MIRLNGFTIFFTGPEVKQVVTIDRLVTGNEVVVVRLNRTVDLIELPVVESNDAIRACSNSIQTRPNVLTECLNAVDVDDHIVIGRQVFTERNFALLDFVSHIFQATNDRIVRWDNLQLLLQIEVLVALQPVHAGNQNLFHFNSIVYAE